MSNAAEDRTNQDVPVVGRDVDISAAAGSQGPTSAEFVCNDCGKGFAKKVGLSQHRRKMHAVKYHQEAKEELEWKVPVKKRWTDVEMNNLAMLEARLLKEGFDGNMNQELFKQFEGRSFDAIKSRRKSEKHRKMVQDLYKAMQPLPNQKEDISRLKVDLPPVKDDFGLGDIVAIP